MRDAILRIVPFFLPLTLGALLTFVWLRGVPALYPEAWARPRLRAAIRGFLAAWILVLISLPVTSFLRIGGAGIRPIAQVVAGEITVVLLLAAPFLALGIRLRRRVMKADEAMRERADGVAEVAAGVEVEAAPKRDVAASPRAGLTRRELALAGARLAPVAGATLAGVGARGATGDAELVEVELAYPELPAALEGLRILHFSDVHLGQFIQLGDVEQLVTQATGAAADLVVLTGDVADDISKLPRALALLESLRPRLGVYASVGNHEYFRGLREVRRAYDKSRVPFLLDEGHTIEVGTARLHLSGADDPRYLGRQNADFFQRTVANNLDGAPSDAFHVLMCHRPEGFPAAREAGVHLTLAGHTHGGQIGLRGRSILEPLLPQQYLWGAYQEGRGRLYTSSGAGHWLPFRIGCPRELPVIKLVRGPLSQSAAKRRIG